MKKSLQVISTYVLLILAIFTVLFVVLDKQTPTPDENLEIASSNADPTSVNQESIVLRNFIDSTETSIHFSDKPTVLAFFTTWCPYCNEDAPKIVELHHKYKDTMNVVGINLSYRDDMEELKHYVDRHHITYPILLDESGTTFSRYNGDMFPALYFIDSQGDVIDEIIGSTDIASIEKSFISLRENFNE